jgi:transcriptional regulator with XRE-family HTH domain
MTNKLDWRNPSDAVAARVRAARKSTGLTVPELAERCAKAGYPELTRQAIYNIESRRARAGGPRVHRPVTVDELIALARALSVAPVNLLVPLGDAEPYPLGGGEVADAGTVRLWVKGRQPLKETNRRTYFNQVPDAEAERGAELVQLQEIHDDRFASGQFRIIEEQEGP